MGTTGNQTGDVSHINHKYGADFVGNIRKDLEINRSGVSGRTGDQQLGLILLRHIPNLVIIDQAGLVIDIIRNNIIVLTGNISRTAVRQMAAVCKAHTHQRIAGLQERQFHSHIGLSTGMGLHIGKLRAKQFLCALDTQSFDLIHIITAAVIALTGQTFRILIC